MPNFETGFSPEKVMPPTDTEKINSQKVDIKNDDNIETSIEPNSYYSHNFVNKIKSLFKRETPFNRNTYAAAEIKAKQAKIISGEKEISAIRAVEGPKKDKEAWKEYNAQVEEILEKLVEEFKQRYGNEEKGISKIEEVIYNTNNPDNKLLEAALKEVRKLGYLDEEGKSSLDYDLEAERAERELENLLQKGQTEATVLNEKYTILSKCLKAQEKSLNNYEPGSPAEEKAKRAYDKQEKKLKKFKEKYLK